MDDDSTAKKFDGGLAFPGSRWEYVNDEIGSCMVRHPGMTLRDWFAGQIINAHVENWLRLISSKPGDSEHAKEQITATAKLVYILADAMLAEREK